MLTIYHVSCMPTACTTIVATSLQCRGLTVSFKMNYYRLPVISITSCRFVVAGQWFRKNFVQLGKIFLTGCGILTRINIKYAYAYTFIHTLLLFTVKSHFQFRHAMVMVIEKFIIQTSMHESNANMYSWYECVF